VTGGWKSADVNGEDKEKKMEKQKNKIGKVIVLVMLMIFGISFTSAELDYTTGEAVYGDFKWVDDQHYYSLWEEWVEEMLHYDGSVGIGTATPSTKLDVNGSINISGSGASLIFPDGTTLSSLGTGALRVNGSIVPEVNSTYDLGTSALAWDDVYAVTYNDLTPAWKTSDGSALDSIKNIKNKDNEIDHETYPIKLRNKYLITEIEEEKTRQIEIGINETTNETIYSTETYIEKSEKSVEVDESLSQLEQEDYVKEKLNISTIKDVRTQFTRDLGGTITMILESVKELFDWNTEQDNQISDLENELIILRAENQVIKIELCNNNKSYSWCSE